MAVVVLPTPPFWLTTAMTFEGIGSGLGLLTGWMVIIGVKRRVSGGWFGGNAEWAVKKYAGLWRTCGMLILRANSRGFARGDVEIFCSTLNIWRVLIGENGVEFCGKVVTE